MTDDNDPVLVDSGATYTPGISERRGTTTTYLHSGLKNAFAQSGTSQNVTATREYDAFGNVTSPSGSWAGPFGYAGKFGYQSPSIPGVTTPDEGITLMGHRYYDSSTGRFLTRDPIFDGRNWYSYGGGDGNPLTQADPDGLSRRPFHRPNGIVRRPHTTYRPPVKGPQRPSSNPNLFQPWNPPGGAPPAGGHVRPPSVPGYWTPSPNSPPSGKPGDGTIWWRPNPGSNDYVRFQPGKSNAQWPNQQVDYVVVYIGGQYRDI